MGPTSPRAGKESFSEILSQQTSTVTSAVTHRGGCRKSGKRLYMRHFGDLLIYKPIHEKLLLDRQRLSQGLEGSSTKWSSIDERAVRKALSTVGRLRRTFRELLTVHRESTQGHRKSFYTTAQQWEMMFFHLLGERRLNQRSWAVLLFTNWVMSMSTTRVRKRLYERRTALVNIMPTGLLSSITAQILEVFGAVFILTQLICLIRPFNRGR